MKKIAFSDKYGLTAAVLDGRKTMTRRIILDITTAKPQYDLGEVVAVAQRYEDAGVCEVVGMADEGQNFYTPIHAVDSPGWRNKMFVRADLMPHRIRITDIRLERLQDISEKDIFAEGIYSVPATHISGNAFTFDNWMSHGIQTSSGSPRGAFAALIDHISRKGTWDSNPWVFAYTFELER